ncbi:hypothetical protein AAFF_G00336750 [Aldrovandia affinis]|uniref:Lipase maturation factor n=1 Tax=Aldrovandia affinis TaxID=143900 RepID=A0AAD7VZR1_9TELE|nr:hypothetical protein AAFF_G00336750 [Aldrovandia affinis]
MATSVQSVETEGNTLRKRRTDSVKPTAKPRHHSSETDAEDVQTKYDKKGAVSLQTGTFWLTRIVLLRSIAFIYLVAFCVALNQNKQLIGQRGLTPCTEYLRSVKRYVGGKVDTSALAYAPTLLWFLDWTDVDSSLDSLALAGLGLSGFVLLSGKANMLIMALLWVLYHSLVSVGQLWYSFVGQGTCSAGLRSVSVPGLLMSQLLIILVCNQGWESQLLETGFLGIFLCPLWSLAQVPPRCPPSRISIWTFRWLIVRIMLGAGLIKIRGDRCWRDLTCMDYHYETQPVPSPMSYYMHRSPWWFHRFETLSNHFIELIAPFLTFLGRRLCMANGALQILFQAALGGAKRAVSTIQSQEAAGRTPPPTRGMLVRRAVQVSLALLIGYLSVPVVMNLFSSRQVMNTSFDPLRIVNTYGAFGSVTKERTEVVFQGTLSSDPQDEAAVWEEYQFVCKPGDVRRRPCLISPYHYRLDWLMWFAAFQTYEQNEWVIHIAGRLLANDSSILSLIQHNPFHGRTPDGFVESTLSTSSVSRVASARARGSGGFASVWVPTSPVDLPGLRKYFQSRNWPHPDIY